LYADEPTVFAVTGKHRIDFRVTDDCDEETMGRHISMHLSPRRRCARSTQNIDVPRKGALHKPSGGAQAADAARATRMFGRPTADPF